MDDCSTGCIGQRRRIGLTGGIGSGKSLALDAFRRLGAAVLSSDEVVHAEPFILLERRAAPRSASDSSRRREWCASSSTTSSGS